MAIPLLKYAPVTQNQRVAGYDIPGDETLDKPGEMMSTATDIDETIWAAYRQVFSEHQILSSNRQKFLESQLRYGQVTVREFIRGLAASDPFLRLNYETNSNYRFVEICVQRLLGRDVYGEEEKIAWSIVVATEGAIGFVDRLVESDEYLDNFGDESVPFQRRRVLASQDAGEMRFNLKTPRYDAFHRNQLGFPQVVWQNQVRRFVPQEKQAKAGDPSNFMAMAQGIKSAQIVSTPGVNVSLLKIAAPYRKTVGNN